MKAASFQLRREGALAGQAADAVVFFGEKDSLYHPAVNIKIEPGQEITFSSGEKSASKSSWYDSFHRVFIFASRNDLDLSTGDFFVHPGFAGLGGEGHRLYVESEQFFDKNLYARLQNVATVHPLAEISRLVNARGNLLTAEEIAR